MCENKVYKELYVFEYTWVIRNLEEKIRCIDNTRTVTSTTFKSHDGNYEWIIDLKLNTNGMYNYYINDSAYTIETMCRRVKASNEILHKKGIQISIGSVDRNNYDERCFSYNTLVENFRNSNGTGDLTIVLKISEPLCTYAPNICETNELRDDYEKLFKLGDQSDFKIIIGDKQFLAHKHILSVRSNYFSAMFKHGTKEQADNQVEIFDVRYEVMFELLQYIYCAKVNIAEDIAYDLLTAADMYQINGLKKKCEKFIIQNLKANNIGECMAYAERYNNDYLKVATSDFLIKYASEFNEGDVDLLKVNLNLISCPFMTSLIIRLLFDTELNKKLQMK